MLDINAVAIFVQSVRSGSFTAAGLVLGMPANPVSRRVKQLEEALGIRLLQRTTRKLGMTTAGREFFERSAMGIEEIERAHQNVVSAGINLHGTVRVAAPADFFDYFRIEWIAAFLEAHPRVHLEFILSGAKSDLIGEGIDMAIRGGELADSTLVARKLAGGHLCLAASPAYVRMHGVPRNVADLAVHQCVILSARDNRTLWHMVGPDGPCEVRVSGRLCVNTMQSVLHATKSGLGIALLPSFLVEADIREQRLVEVLPQYRHNAGGLYAVYPHRRQLSPVVAALIQLMAEKLAHRYPMGEKAESGTS